MTPVREQAAALVALAQVSAVRVRWRISRAAAARARPGTINAGSADYGVVLEVALDRQSSGEWTGVASMIDPRTGVREAVAQAAEPVVVVADGPMTHVEAPGLLSATLEGGKAVYARTPVLTDLGIAGGRYLIDASSLV